jgi:hypothetical protein
MQMPKLYVDPLVRLVVKVDNNVDDAATKS